MRVEGESGVEEVRWLRMGRLKPEALSALPPLPLLPPPLPPAPPPPPPRELELLMEVSRLSMDRGRWEMGNGAITTSGSCNKRTITIPPKHFKKP